VSEEYLPAGWIVDHLANLIQPRGEKVSPSDFPESKFIGMDNIESQTTKILGSVPAHTMKSNASRFYEGDVLYGRLRPYLNKVTLANFNGLASAEFIIFPNTPLLKSSYLKYRLNAADFVNFASHLNEGDRPRVSFDQLGIFKLLLPPLAEQHRIVEKIEELFSDLDDGIASLKKAQQQLKIYRQAVLKWAFEGKLTAQWREEQQQQGKLESAETLLEQIKAERDRRYQEELAQWQTDVEAWEAKGKVGKKPGKPKEAKELPVISKEVVSELPKLPNSWTYTYLAYTGDLGRGKSKHRPRNDPKLFGGTYPFIQTGEVKAAKGILRRFTQTYNELGLSQSKLWPEGTLCITIAANIAETCFLGIKACFPDSVVGFTAYPKLVDPYFVDYFVQSSKAEISAFAPATAQKNINLEILENLLIPYCSPLEQLQIVEEIESRLSICDSLEATIADNLDRAEALRQSILKQAFEGKLVPQDPNDEPASVLLERIRISNAAQAQDKKQTKRKQSL
jgi:type I restriction enzyme S subunit